MSTARDQDAAERYTILKRIGHGGMGEVFLADKLGPGGRSLDMLVVLKTVLPHLADTPERVAKFLGEMGTAATLKHPCIVQVTDYGTLHGSHFIEMEYVHGLALNALLKRRDADGEGYGALPAVDVAWIGMQVCAGLHYAHTHVRKNKSGVLHRDISPDNIMVDVQGAVKITDWGIAKALKGAERQASATTHGYGKAFYMPPEQWDNLVLDARADIYALGITLVVALTGHQVFPCGEDETSRSLAERVCKGRRNPVSTIAPDAPPALQQLLERMIDADRDKRPRTTFELIEQFKAIAIALGGDTDDVREAFAARVDEHYDKGALTEPSMPAMTRPEGANTPSSDARGIPTKSTKRPISAATRDERAGVRVAETEPQRPLAATAPIQTATQPTAPSPSTAAPGSQRSRWPLVIGLGFALVLVLGALTGLGLALGLGDGDEPEDHALTSPPNAPPASGETASVGVGQAEATPPPTVETPAPELTAPVPPARGQATTALPAEGTAPPANPPPEATTEAELVAPPATTGRVRPTVTAPPPVRARRHQDVRPSTGSPHPRQPRQSEDQLPSLESLGL